MESIRWAFNFGAWKPTRAEWLLAGRCIQLEEKTRVSKFVFAKDAKSAIAGRLMLRKLIGEYTNIDNADIRLDRTDKGKPFLVNPVSSSFSFNISHQGSFVVLAAEPHQEVGIDVMKVEYAGGKSVAEFFRTMTRQFTKHEWGKILKPTETIKQLKQFYRFWCLKESYVKAVGIGIGFNLQRLSFDVNTDDVQPQIINTDTRLLIDNKETPNWIFEETMLDSEHCVAVALGLQNSDNSCRNLKPVPFKLLSFDDLISKVNPWQPEDELFWTDFSRKDEYPR